MRTKTILLPLILILNACSPHPGAGGWHAMDKDAKFQRLEIRYAGNADFYINDNDKVAAWRCFWGAADKVTAHLKCIDAGNANNEQTYLFVVDKEAREGVLQLEERVLGRYGWQTPTAPPEE
jgi:hypothetical protein